MNAFLAHLAGIALGETARGAARPSPPPRYARPAASDVGFDAAWIETLPLAPAPAEERPWRADGQVADDPAPLANASPARPTLPDSAAPPGRPGDLRPRPPAPDRQPAAPQPVRAQPAAPQPVRAQPAAPKPVTLPLPVATAAPRSPIAPPVSLSPEDVATDPRAPLAAASLPPGEMRIAASASVPAPRATAPAVVMRERIAAPLSEGALAGRIERPRRAEPVIHVTIDRIEVRAPPTSGAAPPARRPRAEPSVSLSDFLRGGPRIRQ